MGYLQNYFLNLGWNRLASHLFFAFAVVYLVFHALSGERGLYALFKEQRKLQVVQAEYAKVSEERSTLEHKVRLLNSSSLDFDLLDQQAREVLGAVGEDEVVYYPKAQ